MTPRLRGKLVTWKPDKAFGFIRPDQGGKDVFVHQRDFGSISRAPRAGDLVYFQRVADGKGRYRAADVQVEGLQRAAVSAAPRRQRTGRRARGASLASRTGLLITAIFACVLAGLAVFTRLPIIVLPVYVVVSLLAFLLYAFDKSAAMNGRWRTPESTLLLIGLVGGWPGALVAQSLFRHKSSKAPFQASFWFSVLVNCAALAWMCTADGAAAIRTML
jgi:uncharacterized membrane protein YsdA (DUF1294 family)/cold shock CspA family protein